MDITTIILSGGKSSRMGTDKAFVKYKNKALIEYAIEFAQTFSSEIIISANNKLHSKFSLPVVKDIYTNCGPISGIHAGLFVSKTEHNFVLACDIPSMHNTLFEKIIALSNKADIVCPRHSDGKIEPLFAYYSKSCISSIESQIKNNQYALYALIEKLHTLYVEIDNSHSLKNINSPKDLE